MSNQNLTSNKPNSNNQYLSDLLDDQASHKGIDELLASEVQSKAWYRYNMVRSVLTKQNSVHATYNFTQMISAQIADEPAILARPKKSATIIPLWRKSVSGLAIAASVAFVMVFSVQMMDSQSGVELQPGSDFANQNKAVSIPGINGVDGPFIDSRENQAEQAQLDYIQIALEQMNRNNLSENEQLVGGDFMVQSFVVKRKEAVSPFEEKIRDMKKPSETLDK